MNGLSDLIFETVRGETDLGPKSNPLVRMKPIGDTAKKRCPRSMTQRKLMFANSDMAFSDVFAISAISS